MREPRQARLRILDRKILSEAIQHLLSDFGGSQRLASKETGIPQAQLSRMLNQDLGEMGLKHFNHLREVIGEERSAQLQRAFYPPETMPRYTAYVQWVLAETARLQEAPKSYWALPFAGPILMDPNQWPFPQQLYEDDIAQVVEHWKQKCPASYNRFHREMDNLGIPSYRKQLAILRMLTPLLDSRASAYVERDWDELTREEFEAFADAGLKRELIMLQGSAPLQRLQQLVWQKADDGSWVMPDGLKTP